MTLQSLLYAITEVGIKQKVINYAAAGADIYALNSNTIKDWPVLFASPTGDHTISDNTTVYTITLYYLDRLLDDNSNDISVMSVGIEQLKNMIKWVAQINGVVEVENEYVIRNFTETESFADKCAGAWVTIRIKTLNSIICPE